MKKLLSAICCLAVLSLPALAQTFTGFDLNTSSTTNTNSYPNEFVELGSKVYFVAADVTGRFGLWQSDGTQPGTSLVKYVSHGGNLVHYDLTAFNGKLYFHGEATAGDTVNGIELWTSDGTATGTVMLKDLAPGKASSYPDQFYTLNGRLYFTAEGTAGDRELWISDGTAGGTSMLKDINPGSAPGTPLFFTGFNGRLYFAAVGPGTGSELWSTDATTAGTSIVADLRSGTAGSFPNSLTVFNNRLYFQANDGVAGIELWSTDGTTAGTTLLKDIVPGSAGANPDNLTVAGSRLYFAASDPAAGHELWSTDGTAANTAIVSDINPGAAPSDPYGCIALGNKLIFAANDPATGFELWITDGTAAGTMIIKDIKPGSSSSQPAGQKVVYNNKVYFTAAQAADSFGLWVTDGTAAGTLPLAPPVAQYSHPFGFYGYNNFTVALNSIFFGAFYTSTGEELWRFTDGSVPSAIGNVGRGNAASWVVYPSPADGVFTIKRMAARSKVASWKVVDISGRIAQQGQLQDETTSVRYNLARGLYFVEVNDGIERLRLPVVLR